MQNFILCRFKFPGSQSIASDASLKNDRFELQRDWGLEPTILPGPSEAPGLEDQQQ
jgi:hypothetical protein